MSLGCGLYPDRHEEMSPKSQKRVQDASDERKGLAGSSAGADAPWAADLVELSSVQAPRAVRVCRAGGMCLPWSWEFKFCAPVDGQ